MHKLSRIVTSAIITTIIFTQVAMAQGNLDSIFKELNSFVESIGETYSQNTVIDKGDMTTKEIILIELAMDEIGKPYVYGKNGPDSFDCSGFTSYVHQKAGITIPRTSSDQGTSGDTVFDLRPGDLVFFDTRNSENLTDITVDVEDIIPLFDMGPTSESNKDTSLTPSKVTHVGIYIGNNEFIHASSSSEMRVMISSLENKYYKQRYLFAKRYI